MQKKLVKSSLALTAAAALGMGSMFMAGPAMAVDSQVLDVQNSQSVKKVLSSTAGVNAYGVRGDTLYLGVDDPDSKSAKKTASKFGNVNVVQAAKDVKAQAPNDVVGGIGYLSDIPSKPGYTGVCSTGFPGYDGEGNPVVVSAGHCAEDVDEKSNETTGLVVPTDTEKPSTAQANGGEGFDPKGIGPLGEWGYTKFGTDVLEAPSEENPQPEWPEPKDDDIDFSVIKVDASKYNLKKGATDWTTADSDDLSTSTKPITKIGAHTEDTDIQKSGRTTGLTDGTTLKFDEYPFDFQNISGRWVHGFAVVSPLDKPFSQQGDSGGGVFQGETAVGVISGGGVREDNSGNPVDTFTWVADLDYSLDKSGVDFTLDKDAPKPPEAPVAEDQTIAPKGAVTGTAPADSKVKVTWTPTEDNGKHAGQQGEEEVTADADGNFTIEGPDAAGTYAYTATTLGGEAGDSDATEFTVTVEEESAANAADADDNSNGAADGSDDNADGADGSDADANAADGSSDGEETPAERGIVVEPKEILAADFVKKDKGVTITASGFEEGENVTLEVVAGPENVKGVELNQVANKDGVASFSVYGINASSPSVYLGKYDVKVTGADDTADEKALAGSFEVVNDKGGNGGGNGGGSDLPRTGAELTGLAAGAGLLLVGGAAVVLTMRRNSKKN